MYRFSEEKIKNWLKTGKKALLVYGARQVGKTYSIRKVLKDTGISYCEINFLENPTMANDIIKISNTKELVEMFALRAEETLVPGKSVIFFDEVQAFPEIITKIKFLVDEGSYKYVLSGSNLGVELYGIKSMPIGYMEEMQMFPMTLFEFCLALGIKKQTVEYLKRQFMAKQPIDSAIHQKMLGCVYYYLVVGGMPAVVKRFIESRNLYEVDAEQKNIVNQYKADFIKYEAKNRRLKIISVFDLIPSELNKQNRRFIFTALNKELKFDRYEESFLWLKDAAVAIAVYNAGEPKTPLLASKASNLFKLYQSDVGLLVSAYPLSTRMQILERMQEAEINNGGIVENYVAEALTANGFVPYFYKQNKIGEIDFLIETDDGVVPIEVKSGKDYKKHKSLNNLLAESEFAIKKGIVLCTGNICTENAIEYMPLYLAELLGVSQSKHDGHIEVDIDGI